MELEVKKQNTEVSISKTLDNGMTKDMRVRQIENGWVIKKSIYGHDPKTDKYIDVCKEYYTATNPIDEGASAEEEMKGLMNSIKHIQWHSLGST